jgi:hypothetical protein
MLKIKLLLFTLHARMPRDKHNKQEWQKVASHLPLYLFIILLSKCVRWLQVGKQQVKKIRII